MLNVAASKRAAGLKKDASSSHFSHQKGRSKSSAVLLTASQKSSTAQLALRPQPTIWNTKRTSLASSSSGKLISSKDGSQSFRLALMDAPSFEDPITVQLTRLSGVSVREDEMEDDLSGFGESNLGEPLLGRGLEASDRERIWDADIWQEAYNLRGKELEKQQEAETREKEMASDETQESNDSIWGLLEVLNAFLKSYVIYPDSRAHVAWEILVVALVIYNSIMLPFALGFWNETGIPEEIRQIDLFSDVVFWFDLIQNFFLAYVDERGRLNTQKKAIMKNYFSTWFFVDFLACIPLEIFLPQNLVTASSMLKCVRLLRLAKIMRFLEKFEFGVVTKLVRLFSWVSLLCHWIACFWYFIGVETLHVTDCMVVQSGENSNKNENKVYPPSHVMSFCSWLVLGGLDSPLVSSRTKYIRSLYWSITTVMTVGYGHPHPVNTVEFVFYIFVVVAGAGVYANFFSIIVRIIEQADSNTNNYSNKMEDIKTQMKYLRFPLQLQQKVFSHFQFMFMRQRYLMNGGSGPFYKSLPQPLKTLCSEELFYDKLSNVYFLTDCSYSFIAALAREMEPMITIPGQDIVNEGDHSEAWFVINSGHCDVFKTEDGNPRGRFIRELGPNDHFGEIGMLIGSYRTATVRSKTFCDMHFVTVGNFYDLLNKYGEDNRQVLENCSRKLSIHKKNVSTRAHNNNNSAYESFQLSSAGGKQRPSVLPQETFLLSSIDDSKSNRSKSDKRRRSSISLDSETVRKFQL